jgi:hypothetical protein
MGKVNVEWLLVSMEARSKRRVQRSLLSPLELALVEYGDGDCKGFVIITEGCEGRAWRCCAPALRRVLAFFEAPFADRRL